MVELSVNPPGVTQGMLPRKVQEGEMRFSGLQGLVSLASEIERHQWKLSCKGNLLMEWPDADPRSSEQVAG